MQAGHCLFIPSLSYKYLANQFKHVSFVLLNGKKTTVFWASVLRRLLGVRICGAPAGDGDVMVTD